MLQRLLHLQYGIRTVGGSKVGHYEACQDGENKYILIPINNIDNNSIIELDRLSKHLADHGDASVYQFLKDKEGEIIIKWENNHYCVLAKKLHEKRPVTRIGRKLAKFHYRGRTVPFEIRSINRMGMWKTFWEQRLDQMEKAWNDKLFQSPETEFERLFIESFPYYMGLAENAIQYLSDTELDDEPVAIDSGTICHHQFSAQTWGEKGMMKNPFDWIFDHGARDLAEWTRACYFRNIKTYEPDVRLFFLEYTSIATLSSFSWRLLYARLLFPLHYFESVEEYHITSSEQQRHVQEEKLQKYLEQSREYEEFLRDFFSLTGVPVRSMKIPRIDWLQR